jgi:hypothetical protein
MAIRALKDIINNKGYQITANDRKVFEEENLQSFFGFGETDAIEFIIYDSSDNQLPQRNGELVRYIPLTTSNISDYFLLPEGTLLEQYKFPKEYFIDAERLLREAGYENGIFKTSVTLINKRVGSEGINNKLWISEISPSRTEIRLFPLKKGLDETLYNLGLRYEIFKKNGEFRDDTIALAFNFVEKITPAGIKDYVKSKYSDKFYTKMIDEFKIKDFDIFANDVHKLFVQSCIYEFTNRISKIDDLNYGKPKKEKPPIGLSKEEIREQCRNLLVQSVLKYLPLQDIISKVSFDEGKLEGINEVKSILQRLENNTIIDTSSPIVTKIEQRKPFQTEAQIAFKKLLDTQKPPVVDLGPPPKIVLPIDMPPYVEPEPIVVREIVNDTPPPTIIGGGGGGGGSYLDVRDFSDGLRVIDFERGMLKREYVK